MHKIAEEQLPLPGFEEKTGPSLQIHGPLFDLTRDTLKSLMPVVHMKSQKPYIYLSWGKLEKDQSIVAIYQCAESKVVWVRPMAEFVQRFVGVHT